MAPKRWATVDQLLMLLVALLIAVSAVARMLSPSVLRPPPPAQPPEAPPQYVNFSPAPVVKPGPVAVYHGQRAATWIVTGAGDATFNGLYARDGVFNGRPCYTNGRRWLFYFNTGDHWAMDYEMRSVLPDFPYTCRGNQLPGEWKALKGYH